MPQELQDIIPLPPNMSVASISELKARINEGLEDIIAGKVIPAEVVNQRLHEKYGM